MADVLSQSQIDELLNAMKNGGDSPGEKAEETSQKDNGKQEIKYTKYDFYSPRKFTKEKMKLLNSIFENYARILTSQINGVFRIMTDTTVMEIQERRYYEFVNEVGDNDSVTLVSAEAPDSGRNNIPLMINISPGLVLTLISHMLGGGDEIIRVENGYRYSDVEKALYRRICRYYISALRDGFSNYLSIDFNMERVEENLSMVQDVGLDETVATILLNVDVSGMASEKIKICIPGTLLEYLFHLIDSRKHMGRGAVYENNRDIILESLKDSKMTVTGLLAKVELDLNDIYHLHPGDVIDLNHSQNGEVKLFVEKQAWFAGKMGTYKKNMAIQINRRLIEESETQKEKIE
mgnify:CR=1 FL=1